MGERASRQKALMNGAVAGAVLSSIATIVQMTIVILTVQPALLAPLALPLGLGGLAASLYGLMFFFRRAPVGPLKKVDDKVRAFDLKTAAGFAALVGLVLVISGGLNAWLGASGMLLGAAITGLADAHATAASAASLMASNKISSADAVTTILIGLSTNTLMKALVAFKSGGAIYAARIVPGLVLMIVSVWLGMMVGS
jgi:uncharacterized membrane protein (DUF4010 family)